MKKRTKKKRYCGECFWGIYIHGSCPLASGYECVRNPFKHVFMGLLGEHSERKENMQEQYQKSGK